MIRKAVAHDLDAVEQICMEQFAWERRNGSRTGWISGVWPSRTMLRRAIAKGELSVLRDRLDPNSGRMIWAFFILGIDEEPAQREKRAPLTLRLLCVSPLFSRRGLGQLLLREIIDRSHKSRRILRLAVPTLNGPMNALCAKLGFAVRKTVSRPLCENGPTLEFNLCELRETPTAYGQAREKLL